ncbi:MAG: polymerase subunit delta [Nocardioidaceae bacterium]|nr:polymerase subunit delta [Nocardioidaceae bacterium]
MTVWRDLVGQSELVRQLEDAVRGAERARQGEQTSSMTHAWLFTGPPGSGRSNAARAFAAALLCERGGCGECLSCRTALSGAHADVTMVVTEQTVITVGVARETVRQAALSPAGSRWQVMIVEDADRLHERAADALLKSIEEPPPRTVWLLCAPTVEDVAPTIRSRCRPLVLRTPPIADVAAHLVERDGVSESVAIFAARASQGHIGRARALALDETARNRRREVMRVPAQLSDLGSCMTAAANLVDAAAEDAQPRSRSLDDREAADLDLAYGAGTRGVKPTGLAAAHKELDRNQKQRARRFVRDSIDRSLLDLASFYRDVVALQLGSTSDLINEELRQEVATMAQETTGEMSVRRLDAIFAARVALEGEVAPVLALESLMISLRGALDA